jgi:hypothetical protein
MNMNVPAVAEWLGLELRGERYPQKVLCPQGHDTEPSLALYQDHWHCFGCGLHGGAVELLSLFSGRSLGWSRAALRAALENGDLPEPTVPRPRTVQDFSEELESVRAWKPQARETAEAYCRRRWGLELHRIELHGVRVGNEHLYIPHRDGTRVVGVKTHCFVPPREGHKTALPGSTFSTWLYPHNGPVDGNVLLVEGESDCWVAWAVVGLARFAPSPVTVAALPSGAGVWRWEWLGQVERLIVATDTDDAGEAVWTRLVTEHDGRFLLRRFRLPGKDWGEVAAREGLGWLRWWVQANLEKGAA